MSDRALNPPTTDAPAEPHARRGLGHALQAMRAIVIESATAITDIAGDLATDDDRASRVPMPSILSASPQR